MIDLQLPLHYNIQKIQTNIFHSRETVSYLYKDGQSKTYTESYIAERLIAKLKKILPSLDKLKTSKDADIESVGRYMKARLITILNSSSSLEQFCAQEPEVPPKRD